MKYLSKVCMASALLGLGALPISASAHNSTPNDQPYSQGSVSSSGSHNVVSHKAKTRCVKWSKRCHTKSYCKRSKYHCFYCKKYRGQGYYSTRTTCSTDSMRTYRTRGYHCTWYGKKYGSCHHYKTQKWCHTYCSKRVAY